LSSGKILWWKLNRENLEKLVIGLDLKGLFSNFFHANRYNFCSDEFGLA
jgi:hypothetical protein